MTKIANNISNVPYNLPQNPAAGCFLRKFLRFLHGSMQYARQILAFFCEIGNICTLHHQHNAL
jgi:hypothetical protein